MLVTLAEYESHTGTSVSPEDEPRVEELLALASEVVAAHCGWHIAPSRSETIILDGPGGRLLELPSTWVTDVDEIRSDGVIVTQWDVSLRLGVVKRIDWGTWSSRLGGVEVDLVHGYPQTPRVVLAVICNLVRACLVADTIPVGRLSERVGEIEINYGARAQRDAQEARTMPLSDAAKASLAPYRVVRGA